MLPFLRNKLEGSASLPVETMKYQSPEESEYDFLEYVSENLINAVHAKDVKAVCAALRAAFQLCESEPHEEGEHV